MVDGIQITPQKNKNTVFFFSAVREIARAMKAGDKAPRWLLLEGSSRSGKTWSILTGLIVLALNPAMLGRKKLALRCYRNDATTTSDTIVADFMAIMSGLFSGEKDGRHVSLFDCAGSWNKTAKTYTFKNGSAISFHGANNPQKLQGLKADISWLNEAMEISNDARSQIELRSTLFCIADWNPSETDHWIFDSVMTMEGDYLYCHSTYKDNCDLDTGKTNLEPAVVASIEALEPTDENIRKGTANPYKWSVYGLGKRGVREGQVFPRYCWDLVDYFPLPQAWQAHGYGLDFGFSGDPTALIECALSDNCLFVRQLIYERGLFVCPNPDNPKIPSIRARMAQLGVSMDDPIYADSAAAEGCAQLSESGYNIIRATKPKGSINFGLDLMRQRRIFIHRASQQIQKEFENYAYRKRPDGTFSDEPEDKNNHAIDAIRYFVLGRLRNDPGPIKKPRKSKNMKFDY